MAKKSATKPQENPWDSVLASLRTGGQGDVFFVKEGRTAMRLVLEEGRLPQEFFTEVTNRYGKTKYLVMGVISSADGRDIPESDLNRIRGILLPKSALTAIVTNIVEGWELFDLEEGHGIAITRSGSGLNTKYDVTISPRAIPLDDPEWPEKSQEEISEDFTERSLNEEVDEEEETPRRGKKTASNAPSW